MLLTMIVLIDFSEPQFPQMCDVEMSVYLAELEIG